MGDSKMRRGADTIVRVCAEVKQQENVLIVTDPKLAHLGAILADAVRDAQAEPVVCVMTVREADGQEPPRPVASAMVACDVFICPVSKSITHTGAVRDAAAAGARGIMLTQFTDDMMLGGGLEADFQSLAPTCRKMAKMLEGARAIHIATPHGTDLTVSANGRRGNALTCIVQPGQFSPVPNIEANVSPVEGSASGVIVANASIPYAGIGILREPVRAEVSGGVITTISGGAQADILKESLARKNDPNVYNIAEVGIGLNPKCRFTGIMLEDEGVFGSVHIGIGTSITLGGKVKAACHYDLIMTDATIVADGRTILDRGQPRL